MKRVCEACEENTIKDEQDGLSSNHDQMHHSFLELDESLFFDYDRGTNQDRSEPKYARHALDNGTLLSHNTHMGSALLFAKDKDVLREDKVYGEIGRYSLFSFNYLLNSSKKMLSLFKLEETQLSPIATKIHRDEQGAIFNGVSVDTGIRGEYHLMNRETGPLYFYEETLEVDEYSWSYTGESGDKP